MRTIHVLTIGLVASIFLAAYAATRVKPSADSPTRIDPYSEEMRQIQIECAAFYLARQSFFSGNKPEHIEKRKSDLVLFKAHANVAYALSSDKTQVIQALESKARSIQNEILTSTHDTTALTAIAQSHEAVCIRVASQAVTEQATDK